MNIDYRSIQIPGEVEADAKRGDFEVAGFAFDAAAEDLRPPRVVRVGAIQGRTLCYLLLSNLITCMYKIVTSFVIFNAWYW